MDNYKLHTESLHYKVIEEKGEKRYLITGYISTPDKDLYDDIVTKNCLKDMLIQIKNKVIKLDFDHEAWRDSQNILPVGKIIDGKVDEKGLFVTAELNDASPKFKSLWKSIKKGFVDSFSIAFKPIKTSMKNIAGGTARILEEIELLNVALTGVPVNPHASITDVMMKAITEFNEVKNMSEEIIEKSEEIVEKSEEIVEEKVEEVSEPKPEEKPEEVVEEKPEEVVEEKSNEELKSLKDLIEAQNNEIKELKSMVMKLQKEPVMKSIQEDAPAPKADEGFSSIIKNL